MKRVCAAISIALLFPLTACAGGGYYNSESEVFSDSGIVFSAAVYSNRAKACVEEMLNVMRSIDDAVGKNGSLSAVNSAAANEWVQVDEMCYTLFQKAIECAETTDGAFNPAVLPLAKLWGVDRDSGFSAQTPPDYEQLQHVLTYCDYRDFESKSEDGIFFIKKAYAQSELDFGAIAKGYATDLCREICADYDVRSARIDLGGNISLYGQCIDGSERPWRIGINSPRPLLSPIRDIMCAISAYDVSVITSGDYERGYSVDYNGVDLYVTHIIKSNGMPVGITYADGVYKKDESALISATVIGADGALCDALSTACLASDMTTAYNLCENAEVDCLLLTESAYKVSQGVTFTLQETYSGLDAYERL